MNQPNTVSITTRRGIFILCLAFLAYAVVSYAGTLFTAEQSVWQILNNIFLMTIPCVLAFRAFRRLCDKRVHIRLDGHGIYLREAYYRKQNDVRATVNDLTLAWQDIERCELHFRTFYISEVWEIDTRDGVRYEVDLLDYGIWRTRRFVRKIQALHQAAPEQRARLLAEF